MDQRTFDFADPWKDTRPIPTFYEVVEGGPICPWCGELRYADVLEYWPEERAWMFDTCCEGSHQDLCEQAIQCTRESVAAWFEARTGQPIRQVYQSTVEVDFIRLDYGLELRDVSQKTAKAFIREHHRHNPAPAGWRWGHGVYNGEQLVAVGWVGRPVARAIDHAEACEVNRVCVNPDLDPELVWNACSMIYGAAAREAKRRGYKRVLTYTLESESGGTLVAAGWTPVARTKGGSWDTPSRRRDDKAATCPKVRWERGLDKRTRKAIAKQAITL